MQDLETGKADGAAQPGATDANRFVATFIGEPPMNIIAGVVERNGDVVVVRADGHELVRPDDALREPVLASKGADGSVDAGVRPAHLRLAASGEPGLPGVVRVLEVLGDVALLSVVAGERRLRVQVPADLRIAETEPVALGPDASRVHFFDTETVVAIREGDGA